jgi:hypothetical protein
MNDRSLGDPPLTLPMLRKEPSGPFLTAVLRLMPAFVPHGATLVDAYELPDDAAGSATYTTGDYAAYNLTVQRPRTPPNLEEVLLNAVRVDLSSGPPASM